MSWWLTDRSWSWFKGLMTRDYAVPSAIVRKVIIAKSPQAPQWHLTAETRLHSQANPCVEGVAMWSPLPSPFHQCSIHHKHHVTLHRLVWHNQKKTLVTSDSKNSVKRHLLREYVNEHLSLPVFVHSSNPDCRTDCWLTHSSHHRIWLPAAYSYSCRTVTLCVLTLSVLTIEEFQGHFQNK